MSLPESAAKQIKTVCDDGMVIWRYETAQDRLFKALEENAQSKKLHEKIIIEPHVIT